MASKGNGRIHVVFRGRRPGIYGTWIECNKQVSGFSNNTHNSYATYSEAEAAWNAYCNPDHVQDSDGLASTETPRVEEPSPCGSSLSLGGLSLQEENTISVGDSDVFTKDFIVEYSLQALLGHICETLSLPPPMWSLLNSKEIHGVSHHRYSISVACDGFRPPVMKMGDYNTIHDVARDSAALLMLHHLLHKVGKRVKDYNYHIVNHMLGEIHTKDEQISIMAGQISLLEHEIETLKGKNRITN